MQTIEAIRTTIKPMESGYGSPPDACYALIEIYFDSHWWHEASRNFHLTPGENRQRAEQWAKDEEAAVRKNYMLSEQA